MVSLSCFTAPINDLICLTVLGFSARVNDEMTWFWGDHLPSSNFHPNRTVERGQMDTLDGLIVSPDKWARSSVSM